MFGLNAIHNISLHISYSQRDSTFIDLFIYLPLMSQHVSTCPTHFPPFSPLFPPSPPTAACSSCRSGPRDPSVSASQPLASAIARKVTATSSTLLWTWEVLHIPQINANQNSSMFLMCFLIWWRSCTIQFDHFGETDLTILLIEREQQCLLAGCGCHQMIKKTHFLVFVTICKSRLSMAKQAVMWDNYHQVFFGALSWALSAPRCPPMPAAPQLCLISRRRSPQIEMQPAWDLAQRASKIEA